MHLLLNDFITLLPKITNWIQNTCKILHFGFSIGVNVAIWNWRLIQVYAASLCSFMTIIFETFFAQNARTSAFLLETDSRNGLETMGEASSDLLNNVHLIGYYNLLIQLIQNCHFLNICLLIIYFYQHRYILQCKFIPILKIIALNH